MDNSEAKESSQSVRVAVNIRPLVTSELVVGCTDCVTVVPGEPQVQIGSHAFTFDYVFGSGGNPSTRIFDLCVAPLVDALFSGYNGTVLAYGQTGSGKTYTMGTNYNGEEHSGAVIPKVMETIFSRVDAIKDSPEFLIRVSFIEIFNEEVYDLLDANATNCLKGDGIPLIKSSGLTRPTIQIRETLNGGITLAGVTEAEVKTKEEMASYLLRGSVSRATGSTNMNSQSSRSHAIFTISMEQKRVAGSSPLGDDFGDDILSAKLHLVDLAGSERAKRTGADGIRLREGIHINKGLLVLGNVISALGDEKKRKEGGHVPYRDSKLTRLLQDSLGGNSKTVMIACVSPAETNAEETLNTLKYANRARNIQNKAVINRDPVAAQMQRMRSQIEQLQAELLYFRGNSCSPFDEVQILKHKICLLEASNEELKCELKERQVRCEQLTKCAIDAQIEKDSLVMKMESFRNGKSWDEIYSEGNPSFDLVKSYVSKIQELEGELTRLQSSNSSRHSAVDYLGFDDDGLHTKSSLFTMSDAKVADTTGESEDEKELEHSSFQEKLDRELQELDKKLEQKEAEMKRFTGGDTSVLKQHYEKKVQELEQEKSALQKEIEELRRNLANISSESDESAQKLKENYLQKLTALEAQVTELKKKQDAQAQLLRQKQKSDEAAKRLHDEIQRIKTQKVQLQQKMKQESEQFRMWKASREKEVLQLKKEGRRNEYEMHKLLALNQRQKMVLQRKTEEAAMATKRLKDLLESRKTSSRETFGGGNSNIRGVQVLMQAIEHELEVTVRVHEVRSEYERQMKERAGMAKEVAELKEEAQLLKQRNLSDCPQTMSPGARNSRIFALETMLATSSSTLVSMASQLSEAEERERAFSGRGRWNQVRSLAEAKNVMNHLLNLASSSRCSLRDKEVDCREKDAEIRDLKEKVVNLVGQLEKHKDELHQEKLKRLTKKQPKENLQDSEASLANNGEERVYDLRPKGPRNYGGDFDLEDMDTTETDCSDLDDADGEIVEEQCDVDPIDDEWLPPMKIETRRQSQAKKRISKVDSYSGSAALTICVSDSESQKAVSSVGENTIVERENLPTICCSCSKKSLCKTTKCECRALNASCGMSCGCEATKCSNRTVSTKEMDGKLPPGVTGSTDETASRLASHGAMLLKTALSDASVESNDDGGARRKPLSNIGNTLAKSNIPKPNQRKTWRKSVIQLVTTTEPASQPESADAQKKQEGSGAIEVNGPIQLPRAERSMTSNSMLLKERNSLQPKDSFVNKDLGTLAPRSDQLQPEANHEKENSGA